MDFDLDPLNDMLPEASKKKGRAGVKFQPRTKAFCGMGTTVAALAVNNATNVQPISDPMQSATMMDAEDGGLTNSTGSSLAALDGLGTNINFSFSAIPSSGVPLDDAEGDQHSRVGKSSVENVDIFSGLECIQDFSVQSTKEFSAACSHELETQGKSSFPTVNSSASRECNGVAVQIDSERMDSECQQTAGFHDFETQCIPTGSVVPSETGKETHNTSNLHPDSAILPQNPDCVPTEAVFIDEGSIPTITFNHDMDYLSINSDIIPPDCTTVQLPMSGSQLNVSQTSKLENNVSCSEDILGDPEEQLNESGKSSRQLRKRTVDLQHADELEHATQHMCDEFSGGALREEEDSDPEYRLDDDDGLECEVESSHQKKEMRKGRKKVEKDEPVCKRKRANNTSRPTKEPPKKFSHSSRRKRCVNKDLLNTPEDELDLTRLPLRDIILLAEYKERLTAKEAKAMSSNQRSSSFQGEPTNEGAFYVSEQGECHNEAEGNARVQSNFVLFNHQSFMDRTTTARWSKQDTELFFEGIRQFGTDLSMIQQLFPGRTRHQIKLKLKKEERQHPLMVYEALNNRAKDHSYFKKVIEQLQQVNADAELESTRDYSIGETGDEAAELNPKPNEEEVQLEQVKDMPAEDKEAHKGEASVPLKSDESEEEVDIWSSYKSLG
ncbi:hypothetical protein K2173_008429 [Erythroxylum novogranatense]|uniref:Myb-like domain-containing protein n=1 Tax=Erythroxylum novogranatense TaxID=1862640 RepID=A0AAV8U8Y5_9ROSI|nr:hypothetical protein K2173_008429 [Erythroxylum novogranatense]